MEDQKATYKVIIHADWKQLLSNSESRQFLETEVLPPYLKQCRWFGGKAKAFTASISTFLAIPIEDSLVYMLLIKADYGNDESEMYSLALSLTEGPDPAKIENEAAVVATLDKGEQLALIIDAVYDIAFRNYLFQSIHAQKSFQSGDNLLQFQAEEHVRSVDQAEKITSKVLAVEQSNTSIIYGDRFFLKLFRRLEFTTNPDLEVTRFLTMKAKFNHIPAYEGVVQLINQGSQRAVIGLMQAKVPNQGDSWSLLLGLVNDYFEDVVSNDKNIDTAPSEIDINSFTKQEVKVFLNHLVGTNVYSLIRLLAQRTAELHIALSHNHSDPDFRPELVDADYRKSLYKYLKSLVTSRFAMLTQQLTGLPDSVQDDARLILAREKDILKFFKKKLKKDIAVSRIRIHGDYHLGQVLFTGKDFAILDFEGEPEKPYDERRNKHIALKDVAGMIRSFHYAANAVLLENDGNKGNLEKLNPWADLWYQAVTRLFLGTYFKASKGQVYMPKKKNRQAVLQMYLLEKSIYELGYEMNNRPDWVNIPIQGIKHFINTYIEK